MAPATSPPRRVSRRANLAAEDGPQVLGAHLVQSRLASTPAQGGCRPSAEAEKRAVPMRARAARMRATSRSCEAAVRSELGDQRRRALRHGHSPGSALTAPRSRATRTSSSGGQARAAVGRGPAAAQYSLDGAAAHAGIDSRLANLVSLGTEAQEHEGVRRRSRAAVVVALVSSLSSQA